MSEYSIVTKNLCKKYRKKEALKGLNLKLHTDQIIGLIGSNGSGKTSFLKMCIGLEDITSGEICVLGGNPHKDIRIHNQMIYSMHDLPVGATEKLKNVLKYYEIAYPTFDRKFADKLVQLFELPIKKDCRALSQGMKSLFHFICAVATRCKVTLLDEPFIGIDIEKRKLAYEILLRDYMEHPRTILISSHNLSEIEHLLSEMLLIHEGEEVFYKDMDEVREMLFEIEGNKDKIESIVKGLEEHSVCYIRHGEMSSKAILYGSAKCELARKVEMAGLLVSAVTPEEVCVYLTGKNREDALNQLW